MCELPLQKSCDAGLLALVFTGEFRSLSMQPLLIHPGLTTRPKPRTLICWPLNFYRLGDSRSEILDVAVRGGL